MNEILGEKISISDLTTSEEQPNNGSRSDVPDITLQMQVVYNDVILRRIFKNLNWESVRVCRLVCSKWKMISEPLFRKKSRIFFDFDADVGTNHRTPEENMLEDLHEIFENCLEAENPYTAFRFKGVIPVNIPILEKFFQEHMNFIKELTLQRVTLIDVEGKLLQSYNINPLIGSQTKTLNVDCEFSTDFVVSLDRISSVEFLTLRGCRIILNGSRLCPKEVHLSFIRKDREEVTDILVNDFLDFKQMKKLKLRGDHNAVDMSQEVIHLDMLHLERGKVFNWKKAQWIIDKVTLKRVRFVNHCKMIIKELAIIDSSVEVGNLPSTIEKLILARNSEITCRIPCFFPTLNYLQLRHNNISFLAHFANCPSLVDIHLKTNSYSKLDLNTIPRTVRRMKLEEIEIIGDGSFQVTTLILRDYSWENMDRLLTKLLPTNIVIKMDSIKPSEADMASRFLEIHLENKCISLGRFIPSDFETSSLSQWIDGKSEYYDFDGQTKSAIGISQIQFELKFKM